MIEIERKFLVTSNWLEAIRDVTPSVIKQGYISTDINRVVRVRTINDNEAYITIKGKTEGISRPEFEYEIPMKDAHQILQMCVPTIITKSRYVLPANAKQRGYPHWEIDVFSGANQGLVVAEIELESENTEVVLPSWVGEEVTTFSQYSNSELAQYPFIDWINGKYRR